MAIIHLTNLRSKLTVKAGLQVYFFLFCAALMRKRWRVNVWHHEEGPMYCSTAAKQETQRRVEKQTVQTVSKYDFCQAAHKRQGDTDQSCSL